MKWNYVGNFGDPSHLLFFPPIIESIENETEFNAGHAFVRPGFKYFPMFHVSKIDKF